MKSTMQRLTEEVLKLEAYCYVLLSINASFALKYWGWM